MIKQIIGKLFCLLFFCSSLSLVAQPSISLQITDLDGAPLSQAGAGIPFTLVVNITASRSTAHTPRILGSDSYQIRSSGVHMNVINGLANIKYNYQVIIDKPGTYTIGPGEIMEQGKTIRSNTIQIVVGKTQITDNKAIAQQQNTEKKALLKVVVDKQEVVVGEKIICAVRFYYTDVELQSIKVPEFAHFKAREKQGPFTGHQTIDGITYHYAEWRWELLPQNPGTIIIPVFSADFIENDVEDAFANMANLLRSMNMMQRKRIYSNTITMHVLPLPPHEKKVIAVGSFKKLSARVDTPMLKEGDAALLTIELEGDGNIHALESFELIGMPEGLKWYPSKVYENNKNKQTLSKCFEFIVQGVKAGDWQIPEQSLIYFDTQKKEYSTLQSVPVDLKVMVRAQAPTQKELLTQNSNNQVLIDQESTQNNENDDLASLCTNCYDYNCLPGVFVYCPENTRGLPWWLFFILFFVPVISTIGYCIYCLYRNFWQKYDATWRKRNAFVLARKKLKIIEKGHAYNQLQTLFIQLFADYFSVPNAQISSEQMINFMKKAHFSQQDCQAWENYYASLEEVNFFQQKKTARNYKKIIDDAYLWLARLEATL